MWKLTGAATRKVVRMTIQRTCEDGIKGIAEASAARGNKGANRGRKYRRRSVDDDSGRLFADVVMAAVRASGMKEYSSKYSNHVYSDYQKLATLAFMALRRIAYNSLGDVLGMYRGFVEGVGLKSVPHGSTMCKFASRVDKATVSKVINGFCRVLADPSTLVVDATGLSDFDRSAHYEKRCDELGKSLPPRSFTKLSLAMDAQTRLVLSADASASRRADTTFLPGHVEELAKAGAEVVWLLADKGYDSGRNHRIVREGLRAQAVIPVRGSPKNSGYGVHGPDRRMMREALADPYSPESTAYRRRCIVESTNFMIKHLTGASITALEPGKREKQALFKVLAFDVWTTISLGRTGVFL